METAAKDANLIPQGLDLEDVSVERGRVSISLRSAAPSACCPLWWSPPQLPAGSKVVRPVTTAPVAITSSKTSPLTPAKRPETWSASAPLQHGSPERHHVE